MDTKLKNGNEIEIETEDSRVNDNGMENDNINGNGKEGIGIEDKRINGSGKEGIEDNRINGNGAEGIEDNRINVNGKQGSKRKRNKAKWTGFIIVTLASAIFVMLFSVFIKEASEYFQSAGMNELERDNVIASLIQTNYLLYKDIKDRSDSKIYTYDELFMTETLENVKNGSEYQENIEDYYEMDWDYPLEGYEQTVGAEQLMSILSLYEQQMQQSAMVAQNSYEYKEIISRKMDYYVLDKSTGINFKNTSLPIEKLLKTEQKKHLETEEDENAVNMDDIYDYYVIMDYNEAGKLQNVSVRGRDADALLKTVQAVEGSSLGRLLSEREEVETFALYDEDEGRVTKLLTISQKKPANATFVYAATQEQIEDIPSIYGYYASGVEESYVLFLAGMFIIVMLLALCRPGLLDGKTERKMPLEVILAVAIILAGFGVEIVVELTMCVGCGDMREWLDSISALQGKPWFDKDILEAALCFCVMAFLFGIGYFCCLELSDVVRDFKKYFRTRSLVYRLVSWLYRKISGFFTKTYRNIKTEVLDADLGKDMNKLLRHLLFINFCILATFCLLWGFGIPMLLAYSLALYLLLRKYIYKIQEQYGKLLEAANSIAEGSLNNTFEEDFGVFESYKEELYKIQDGFKKAVEEEVKSQKMKTELITNVSHDLKTPLTAIITYIDLLKEENTTEEQRNEYLKTLERKSLRLKILIEDLFEVSKASSGNINLELVSVDICNLLRQAYLEQEDKMQQAGLQVRFTMPEEKVIMQLDSQKTYRIFENLYVNIIKYALPETRVFVSLEKKEDGKGIHIELKNISAQEITENPYDLTERFVRGDASRNTEGSGLGLAIARSLTELQGGSLKVETDGDLFKVVLDW